MKNVSFPRLGVLAVARKKPKLERLSPLKVRLEGEAIAHIDSQLHPYIPTLALALQIDAAYGSAERIRYAQPRRR